MGRWVLIIGSGFGGLGLGIRLARAGIDFTILEKAPSLGGTWRENTYPGAACDVPSVLYSFSFEPKTDWSRKWSPHGEIREYLEDCAARNGVLPHIRFNTEVTGARFDDASGTWTVRTASGEELTADVLVSAVGQLHHPVTPKLPGLESFRGPTFHSARWNHDVDLAAKRVAVVGNAASAIQFIPEIAPKVSKLTIFQRSANWMLPRGDRAYSEREKRWLTRVPGLAKLLRFWTWAQLELWLYPVVAGNRPLSRLQQWASTKYMESLVGDPVLRRTLRPDYPIGGKRILITDGYYEALGRENVAVVTDAIDHVTEDTIVTRDGTTHPADVVIFATGFRTNPFLAAIRIEGMDGRVLERDWAAGAEAYYGLTVPGYPNFFMLYGPNTNLGHNSIIFMMEAQMRYVLGALDTLEREQLRWVDVRPEVAGAYNARVQRKLATTAWAQAGPSWYKDAGGRITNNWPWSTLRYWWETHAFDAQSYRTAKRGAEVVDFAEARAAAGGRR
jgi:cation diffusion facilitator CzcD-associated flavoprotein CzcO